jgi:hypothetical protein
MTFTLSGTRPYLEKVADIFTDSTDSSGRHSSYGKNVVLIINVIIVYMATHVIIINCIVGTKDKHEPVSLTWSKL